MWLTTITLISTFFACALGSDTADQSCPADFSSALKAGLWSCARSLADSKPSSGMDMRNMLEMETRVIVKELAELKKHLESALPMSNIHPAYQWAQSPDEIFLSVKFAHKLDTPGTLNVEAKNVTITDQKLELLASDGRKNFILSLDFLREVEPEDATWSMASVGRMSFTIRKKQTKESHPHGSNWPRLLRDRKKTPNQHFWYEMHDKYSKLLDKVPDEDDDEDGAKEKKAKAKVAAKPTPPKASEEKKEQKREKAKEPLESASTTPAAYKEALKTLHKDRKNDLAAVDVSGKSRKKMLDAKCKAEKAEVDADVSTRKAKIEEEYKQQLADLQFEHGVQTDDAKVTEQGQEQQQEQEASTSAATADRAAIHDM